MFARLPRSTLFPYTTLFRSEKGLWGSEYFAEHPTVPLANIVADLNSDMVGRNWKDTIAVIGKEHSDLGRSCPSSSDRKSTRLNSSHGSISYAVFCLKKKKKI